MSARLDSPAASSRQILSVSELNRKAKSLLELHLPLLWVEGELSNFSKPSSGHWYFTLKDEKAQVRCAMFRNRNTALRFSPKAGDKVVVRAKTSLYEGRGDYQLIVEHMEDAGFGLLQRQYEELKVKLDQQGLFDPTTKKPLPPMVSHIAIITSPTGAAVRDVVAVMKRRFPAIKLTILPVAVQGDGAAEQMITSLKWANELGCFDVILLCRGGGSIEDLWAFNHEALAHSIYESQLPVVSAVGHEIDFTIADFVADVRAATPSAAAELLSPDRAELMQTFLQYERTLTGAIRTTLSQAKQHLFAQQRLLRHPGQQILAWSQRLDQLELRLVKSWQQILAQQQLRIANLISRLQSRSPKTEIQRKRQYLQDLQQRLERAATGVVEHKKQSLEKAASMLHLVSPLKTLERGYSIARKPDNGEVIRDARQIRKGDELEVLLHQGKLRVTALSTASATNKK